jgi:hypothetical protein
MAGLIDTIKGWFRRAESDVEDEAEGLRPVATPPDGVSEETSTNAQTAGASDQPWPGNE